MRITVDIAPEVEDWLNSKLQSGTINSADEFINATLERDRLEEIIEESLADTATPLTPNDWRQLRLSVASSGRA